MATGKNKYNVLVASSSDKLKTFVSSVLPAYDYDILSSISSADLIRRRVLEMNVDLVVLNTPLSEELGSQLALDLAQDNIGVLMLVSEDVYDQVVYKVEDYGVMVLSKPLYRDSFYKAMKLLTAMRGKLMQMDKKQQQLQEKMLDIRTINQAKWLLIEHQRMSEADAHYYIEKMAMDHRTSRRQAALKIIQNYQ